MARSIWAVTVFLALAPLAAGAQCPSPPADRAALTVKGSATVERAPDVAKLSLSLITRGATLAGVSRDHQARVVQASAMLARLKTKGLSVDQGSFALFEDPAAAAPGVRPGSEPPVYRADTRYAITVGSVDGLDAVMAEVASAGLFELGSARFSVADRAAATDDARRAAMADAMRQAEVYADAGRVRLDAIDRITDAGAEGPGDAVFDLPVRMARSVSVGITRPRSLTFSGSVTVTWHIVPR